MRASIGRRVLAGVACGLVLLAAFLVQRWLGAHGRSAGGIGMIAFAATAAWLWFAIARPRTGKPGNRA